MPPHRTGETGPAPKTKMLPHAFNPAQEGNVKKPMTHAQRKALATIIGKQVGASAGLPDPGSKPFADQLPPSHKPAKDKYVPDLTDRTAVARGLRERRDQHGLLTPAQRAAEAKATLPAAEAPSFHSRHDLTRTPLGDLTPPPVPHMSLQEIANMLGMGRQGMRGAFLPSTPGPPNRLAPPPPPADLLSPARNGREQLQRDQPHQGSFLPAVSEWLQGPAVGKGNAAWLGRHVLGPAASYAGTGLATGMRDLFEGATGIGGPSAIDQILHQKDLQKHIKEGWTTQDALNQRIRNSEYHGPDLSKILVPVTDLKGVISNATNAEIAKGADGRQAVIPLSELASVTGWGLTDAARKRGREMIKRRGWTDAQAEAMAGDPTQFIKMQYSDPPSLAESILKGAAQNIITGGSQSVGFLGLGSEAAQGRGTEALASLLDQLHQVVPVFGKHPTADEFVANPLFTATAGAALAKHAGGIGRVLPYAPRERIQTLKGQIDHLTGEPAQIYRGHYDKNLYTGLQQFMHDQLISHSALAAKHTWKRVGDLMVAHERARITPEHLPVQVGYREAMRAVGPERAEELMALHDYGGAPGVEDARAHFQALQNAGIEVPQARIELLNRLHEVQASLTPADEEFLRQHAGIAEHTSTAMQNRGAHTALTQLYRKYETVIEMGAAAERRAAEEAGTEPSGPFTEAKRARDEYQHMHENGGHPSERWVARQKELLRNIAGHLKRASTASARKVKAFQEADKVYREALKPFREKQREIKAREPEKPPPRGAATPPGTTKVSEDTRTKTFATRAEALSAAKPVKEKHPDWTVKVSRGEGTSWDVEVTRPSGETKAATVAPAAADFKARPVEGVDNTVEINGRRYKVTVAADGVARASFSEGGKGGTRWRGPARTSRRAAITDAQKHARAAAETAAPAGKSAAQIAAEHKAWREELKAHNATRPVRPEPPPGLSRNAGRLAVHEGEVTREGKRAKRYEEALPPAKPDDEIIMQQYHDAVHAAVAAHHARPDAIEPARVARTNLPLDKNHKFPGRRRTLTSNLNVQHSQFSTGKTALSGNYIYHPEMPLRENVDEHMNRMKAGLYNAIVGHPLVHDATGGGDKNARRVKADGGTEAEIEAAREPVFVPEGVVAVPVHYPGSSAQVTVPHWGSEAPVRNSETRDPNKKPSRAERILQRKKDEGHLAPHEKIPDGARVLLIPEGLYERLEEHAHPNGGADPNWYEKANRYYQKLLVGLYPSTWLGNGPGSLALSFASGAYHPRDFYRAFKSGPQGRLSRRLGIERTDSRPAHLQNLGPGGGLGRNLGREGNPITQFVEGGRAVSVTGENYAAAVSWEGRARVGVDGRLPTLRKILPALDKIMPEHLKGAAVQMSVDSATMHRWLREQKITIKPGETLPDEIQAMLDRGETKLLPGSLEGERSYPLPPEIQELADRLATDVTDFMSEGNRPRGSIGRTIGHVILFQSWIGHIIKLTLFTLPVKHPRRAALLNAVSMYGQQYRRQHGVYPDWMAQFFPIGREGNYERSVGLGQLTPTASALNLAQAGSNMLAQDSPNNSYLQQINQVISPLLQPLGDVALANYDNARLKPSEASKRQSPLHAFTSGAYFAIPGAHKFQPLSGYNRWSAGFMGHAIPYTGGLTKKDYFVYLDNGDGTFQKLPIRWGDRPGGHPETGFAGAISRVAGLPLERSAREGRQWHNTITNDRTFANVDDYKRRFPFG